MADPCPICGNRIENLGHCYRAPVKTNKRGWKRVDLFIEAKRERGLRADQSPTFSSNDVFNPPSLLPKAQRPNPKRKKPETAYQESKWRKDSDKRREDLKARLKARLSLTPEVK